MYKVKARSLLQIVPGLIGFNLSNLSKSNSKTMTKLRKTNITSLANSFSRKDSMRTPSNRLCILFWQRRCKTPGYVMINCRLTYNGQRHDATTGLKCLKGHFDPERQTMVDNFEYDILLSDIVTKVNSTYADFRITGRPIDLRLIWAVAKGQTPEMPENDLIQCINAFFAQRKEEYELGRLAHVTFQKMRTWNKRLISFATMVYGKHGAIDDVKPGDSHKLLLWLQKEHGCANNSGVMVVAHFKRILNFAVENEWITRNPFMNYRRKFDKLLTERLTESEIDQLKNAEIFAPAVEHIRRAFVFQCYTGLPYIDLARVTESHIIIDEKTGAEFIKISRTKTGTDSIIPLIVEARTIINSFSDHPMRKEKGVLIPIVSNQKYNVHLKQLSGLVGLNKRLTTHVARRTAATLFLTKGAPLESVSAMLGHTTTTTTQKHYSVTRPERVVRDIQAITQLSIAQ
jgi:site-specific recombinase XerD